MHVIQDPFQAPYPRGLSCTYYRNPYMHVVQNPFHTPYPENSKMHVKQDPFHPPYPGAL